MERVSLLDPAWSDYCATFRQDAHQLLAWGYEDARRQLTPDLEEDDITGLISEAVEERLDGIDTPDYWNRYAIKEQARVRKTGAAGKRRKIMDIVVQCSDGTKPRPEFVFEAKRLRKNGYPIGNYAGSEGLLRFVRCEYAAGWPEAALVGYMQSDGASYWSAELSRCFRSDAAGHLACTVQPVKTHAISNLPDEWVSKHARVDRSTVTIYHIFLDCT
jgi:hypothetical protein